MTEDKKQDDALEKAMKLCAGRELCISDIEIRLKKWGIKPPDRERILKTLKKEKFIDDVRYSLAYAKDKFRHNRWGKVKIAVMLRSKGIDEDTIRQALNSIDETEYSDTLRKLLETHKKSVRAKNPGEFRAKLARFAVSRGFEPDLVFQLLGED